MNYNSLLQCNFYKINYTLFWFYQIYIWILWQHVNIVHVKNIPIALKKASEVHGYICHACLQVCKVLNWSLCIIHVALFLCVIVVVVASLCWGWFILCVLPRTQPPIPNISNVLKSLGDASYSISWCFIVVCFLWVFEVGLGTCNDYALLIIPSDLFTHVLTPSQTIHLQCFLIHVVHVVFWIKWLAKSMHGE